MVRFFILPLMMGSAALAVPGAARAAPIPASPAVEGSATLMKPLTLKKLRDMDFGTLAVSTAGTAVINPVTGALSVTGGVLALGGAPQPARFAGATSSSAVVNIKLPNSAVFITRAGGTETIRVDSFTLDGQSKRTMAQAGVFEFNVGATLRPVANQAIGLYSGTFEVTIQYP